MSEPQSNEARNCPACGAPMPVGSDHCWVCRWEERHAEKTEEGKAAAKPMAAPTTPAKAKPAQAARATKTSGKQPQQSAPFQFSLSALVFVMIAVAVLCAITVIMPGVGIGLIILSIPAWIRTIVIASRQQDRGRAMSLHQKINTFFAAVGVFLAVSVAAFTAFAAICVPAGLLAFESRKPESFAIVFMAIAAVIGLTVFILLVRIWFRSQAKHYGWNDKQDRS
jgi:hypothetical protein